MLWFLNGDTNIKYLKDNGVSIWDEWAVEDGSLGPVYGKQWVKWECVNGHVNQIQDLIDGIINRPFSRRHIISAWNPEFLPIESIPPQENVKLGRQALPPCHVMAQFYVHDGKLSCQLYQRSADIFLGAPFNIASYSLLTMMLAKICGLTSGEFIHTIGDAHIYLNHLDQVNTMLAREPYDLPTLHINYTGQKYNEFKYEDFVLMDYNSHPAIRAPIAV